MIQNNYKDNPFQLAAVVANDADALGKRSVLLTIKVDDQILTKSGKFADLGQLIGEVIGSQDVFVMQSAAADESADADSAETAPVPVATAAANDWEGDWDDDEF